SSLPGPVRHLGFAFSQQARHDDRPNRVRFLRTSRSPPVALHPASRRRSYVQLRSSDLTSARTCTSRIQDTCKRTGTGGSPVRTGEDAGSTTTSVIGTL